MRLISVYLDNEAKRAERAQATIQEIADIIASNLDGAIARYNTIGQHERLLPARLGIPPPLLWGIFYAKSAELYAFPLKSRQNPREKRYPIIRF